MQTNAQQSAPALAVYYDGACPVCSREIALYKNSAGGDTIQWIDATSCDLGALQADSKDLTRESALARMHVRKANGELVSGAAAFVAMWEQLPKFAMLARLARIPGAMLVLELGYRGFLRLRPLWRKAPADAATPIAATPIFPLELTRELRTDHAGETGAVMIYRGILAVSRDAEVRAFAEHHLATEQEHLRLLEALEPPVLRSRLLPLWRLSGWFTGAVPALFGARAVFATIQAVETFVDHHYADQLAMIDRLDPLSTQAQLQALRQILAQCQQDEVAHRDDAAARLSQTPSDFLRLWTAIVDFGSRQAVKVCRYV
jgi:3-demethoxyubiquinol 3-hydroxylase